MKGVEQDINVVVTMTDIGLLVDISDPGGGDRGGALGPLNLRRGRNSLASSHPKTLEVNIKYLDTFLDQSSYLLSLIHI